MQHLQIQATDATPLIDLNPNAPDTLRIEGESYPENTFEFYHPILHWMSELIHSRPASITLKLRLFYLNTGSIKCFMDILEMLDEAHHQGIRVQVEWLYDEDNERALELGEDFAEDLDLAFHLVAQA